ncbi:hypothetical protein [Methanobrevibacter sp.]|uniref:hypothetical protein n=1 Tax=Methanobrevibacter sp. TaxID=66852 RepID=UPI00388DBD38
MNGNNHTINGNGRAALFSTSAKYLEINDLTIKNCVGHVIYVSDSNLVLNNVRFITDSTDFEDENMEFNGIYAWYSSININNSLFCGNNNDEYSAIAAMSDNVLNIENTQFIDLNSTYDSAITIFDSSVTVKSSSFKNTMQT